MKTKLALLFLALASLLCIAAINDNTATQDGRFTITPGEVRVDGQLLSTTGSLAIVSNMIKVVEGSTNALNIRMGQAEADIISLAATNISVTPSGSIVMWPTDTPPAGWLICDGAEVSRETYSNLYEIIGDTYGEGDGSTTFNLPNFTGQFPYGGGTAGVTGGVSQITLASNNIPAHLHRINPPSTTSTTQSAAHVHSVNPPAETTGTESLDHTHTVTLARYIGDLLGPAAPELGTSAGYFYVTNRPTAVAHSITSSVKSSTHTHGYNLDAFNSESESATHTHATDISEFNSAEFGAGEAFTSLPPYLTINFIIKY